MTRRYWVGAVCVLAVSCRMMVTVYGPDDAGADAATLDAACVFCDVAAADACVNLACNQVTCSGIVTTTISGIVTDPAGTPLYNAIVFVPNAPLQPIIHGAQCQEQCQLLSGSPLVIAVTDVHGHFTLSDAPAAANVPIVIQVGTWRKRINRDISACVDNPLDPAATRLPSAPLQVPPTMTSRPSP